MLTFIRIEILKPAELQVARHADKYIDTSVHNELWLRVKLKWHLYFCQNHIDLKHPVNKLCNPTYTMTNSEQTFQRYPKSTNG